MTDEEYKHYVDKYKEHEKNAVSTNERNHYWRNRQELLKKVPKSLARFEHG